MRVLVGKREVKGISWKGPIPSTRKLLERHGPYSLARYGFREGEGKDFRQHRFHLGGNQFLDVVTRKDGKTWKLNLERLEFDKSRNDFRKKSRETVAEFGLREDAFNAHLKLVDIIKRARSWEEVASELKRALDKGL